MIVKETASHRVDGIVRVIWISARNCATRMETLNGSLRDEGLNVHWFETIDEARARIEAWRVENNESRPHQALKDLTPAECAGQARHLVTSEEFSNAEV